MIFLPGTNEQIKILFDVLTLNFSSILIIGSGCEEISKMLADKYSSPVTIIVDNHDSLLNTRLLLTGQKDVTVKMMDFSNTDFPDSAFDLIYAQASISNNNRNKTVKEIKRILKPGGYFCAGENISLVQSPPTFVKDIWNSSNITPLYPVELKKFYEDRNFEVIHEQDLSHTLKDFYSMSRALLKEKVNDLTDQEKNYHKKFLKKLSHESNAYLKLGGDVYMGFRMLILRKA